MIHPPTVPQVVCDYPHLPSARTLWSQCNKNYPTLLVISIHPLLLAISPHFSLSRLELSPVVYWVLFAAIAIASLSKICFYCCNCYSALVFFDASTNAFGLLEFCTTPLPLNNCRPVWGGKNQNKQNLGSTTLPPPVRARTKGGRSTGRYSIRRELHQKGKLWEQLHEF